MSPSRGLGGLGASNAPALGADITPSPLIVWRGPSRCYPLTLGEGEGRELLEGAGLEDVAGADGVIVGVADGTADTDGAAEGAAEADGADDGVTVAVGAAEREDLGPVGEAVGAGPEEAAAPLPPPPEVAASASKRRGEPCPT